MIHTEIRKWLYRIGRASLLPLLAAGCVAVDLSDDGPLVPADGERPVVFEFLLPDEETPTRADLNNGPARTFAKGDVIHIAAEFELNNGTYESRYGAMSYDAGSRQWGPVNGSLTWPAASRKGKFTAYFIHRIETTESGGVINDGETLGPYLLSELTAEADPLWAVSESNTGTAGSGGEEAQEPEPAWVGPQGHAVKLRFRHLCAHLTLTGLGTKVADYYWLTQTNGGTSETVSASFSNAFSLTRNGDALVLNWVQLPSAEYGKTDDSGKVTEGKVYIAGKVESTDEGTQAAYFLRPGKYSEFELHYPASAPKSYKYLQYTNIAADDSDHTFRAGGQYKLDVSRAKGVTIIEPDDPSDEKTWDEDETPVWVDPVEFMYAVVNGVDYRNEDGTLILQETEDGTVLLHNVDFRFHTYNLEGGDLESEKYETLFMANLPSSKIFDGGYHYICNLGSPFVRYNNGTIRNVGFRKFAKDEAGNPVEIISKENLEGVSDPEEEADSNRDMSRQGAVCMWNRTSGVIDNIRVENVSMRVLVDNAEDPDEAAKESHNAGCLVGSNSGTLTRVTLSGEFSIQVDGYQVDGYKEKKDVNAKLLVGGLVGQNAGGFARIEDVTTSPTTVIEVKNLCRGTIPAFYFGGAIGLCSSSTKHVVLPSVSIDCTGSRGIVSYIGALGGEFDLVDALVPVESCIVIGEVKAGAVAPSQYNLGLESVSYIGGIAGAVRLPITDCSASVDVYGPTQPDPTQSVLYATGGAFGRIRPDSGQEVTFSNIIAYGNVLEGPSGQEGFYEAYIGNFAGIAPADRDWNGYYSTSGNIKSFSSYEMIGLSSDIKGAGGEE